MTLGKAAQDPSQGSQVVATSQIRTSMVNTLVQAELNRQLAAREHLSYDRGTLRSVMDQFESVAKKVPTKDQEHFRDLVESVYRGQLEVYTLAQSELASQGAESPTQDQVQQAVADIQAKFRKGVEVKVNPEYGAAADGFAGTADPSLSLAVSSFAKQSQATPPDSSASAAVRAQYDAWLAKLPSDQRCG